MAKLHIPQSPNPYITVQIEGARKKYKNDYINVYHHAEFFPENSFETHLQFQPITFHLAGVGTYEAKINAKNHIGTDIRRQNIIGKFLDMHKLEYYDFVVIEKVAEREYSLYPQRNQVSYS